MSAQSLKIVFISGSGAEPDEMPHSAVWMSPHGKGEGHIVFSADSVSFGIREGIGVTISHVQNIS